MPEGSGEVRRTRIISTQKLGRRVDFRWKVARRLAGDGAGDGW